MLTVSGTELSLLHLKLDRVLAGQTQILSGQGDINATIETLVAAMANLSDTMNVQRELLVRLAEATSDEGNANEMRDLIISITQSLQKIQEDGARMVSMLAEMPKAISKSTHESVVMAMGGAVDPKGSDEEG